MKTSTCMRAASSAITVFGVFRIGDVGLDDDRCFLAPTSVNLRITVIVGAAHAVGQRSAPATGKGQRCGQA